MMKILLIEDEAAIAGVIKQGLEEAHYRVMTATNGLEGLAMATEGLYSLIILDIMLPGMDGWTICERLREKRNSTPILMLTARDNVRDKVKGLEIGADDYLSKPFNFGELLARVNALIRRDRMHKTKIITIGDLTIDPSARRVERAGKEVSLTEREFTLLEALASHEGQVLTREAIQERVWLDEDSYSNTVDVYIGSLRKKIDASFDEKLIRTVHGVGYTLRRTPE
jgi:DNA-binding response OmpR family regulator